jgi:photosystem II stability/assembly factor-like uncharacterized protein
MVMRTSGFSLLAVALAVAALRKGSARIVPLAIFLLALTVTTGCGQGGHVTAQPTVATSTTAPPTASAPVISGPETSPSVVYSEDGGATWHASSLTGVTNAIAADPSDSSVAYAVQPDAGAGIQIMNTVDGGVTWNEMAHMPSDAGSWPYDMTTCSTLDGELRLFVGTQTGLWTSDDDGATWARIDSLPAVPAFRVATATSGATTVVFVSLVASPPNAVLYSSTDLTHWKKEADGVDSLSESTDGSQVFALDELQPDQALVLGVESRQYIALPHGLSGEAASPILRMVGNLTDSSIVGQSGGDIWLSPDGGATWRIVSQGSFASLAASADGSTFLAGGFRTAMSRSVDGGQTWSTLAGSPVTVSAIRFLSANRVVAATEKIEGSIVPSLPETK